MILNGYVLKVQEIMHFRDKYYGYLRGRCINGHFTYPDEANSDMRHAHTRLQCRATVAGRKEIRPNMAAQFQMAMTSISTAILIFNNMPIRLASRWHEIFH